jgi:hypothetical protein
MQKLARSSEIVLQKCKSLREVRESFCKNAKACAKFGNRFAKMQKLARSSENVLQKCKSLREVRKTFCIIFMLSAA